MTGDPYYARDWYRRSRLPHAKDNGRRMFAPTPRWCNGIERDDGMTKGEKVVLLGCLIGIVLMATL